MPKSGRTQRHFPGLNQGGLPGDRPEEIGFSDIAVVQPVLCVRLKMSASRVQPRKGIVTPNWYSSSRSPCSGDKREILAVRKIEKRPRGRQQRRRLIKMAVKRAKDPIQLRNFHGNAEARVHSFPRCLRVKCDWRKPAINVSHGVTLNLSLKNISSSPPVIEAEREENSGKAERRAETRY